MEAIVLEQVALQLQRLEDLNEQATALRNEVANLITPTPPQYVEEFSDWEKHEAAMWQYNEECTRIRNAATSIEAENKSIEGEIKKMLPRNVWFKVETLNGPRWVGVESSDWGGGEYTLYIKRVRPEYPLKHRIVN